MSVGPSPQDIHEMNIMSQNSHQRTSYWTRLLKKWRRRGVVEIGIDHHRYHLLRCIRLGLEEILENQPEQGPKLELLADDFTSVHQFTITGPNGRSFQFTSYASSVFATIRQAMGITETAFLSSIVTDEPYLEFISTSHGGQHFYLSNDKAYFMKTEAKHGVDLFQSILHKYWDHFLRFPHSLLVKYLGLFSVKLPGQKVLHFYIMQSVFYPTDRIEMRYDLKGCLAGRYQKSPPPGSEVPTVYKDRNFVGQVINLGDQSEWFLAQVQQDVAFLSKLGVQDYSLLVAVQSLHNDEKNQNFGDVVVRVRKSVAHVSPRRSRIRSYTASQTSVTPEALQTADSAPPTELVSNTEAQVRPSLTRRPLSFIDPLSLSEIGASNLRMLPNCRNPLHVIDGPSCRYFVGIIDFFTLYKCRQQMGRVIKSIKYCCGDHSTVPPVVYARRFLNFVSDHTT